MPSLIPTHQLDDVARRFRLLSEPVRLELLDALHQYGAMTVGDLVDVTGHRQANVSKHLSMMAEQDVLGRQRDGVYVYYSIADPTIAALCQLVRGRLHGDLGDSADD